MAQLEKLAVTMTEFYFTQTKVSFLKIKHSVMRLQNGMD